MSFVLLIQPITDLSICKGEKKVQKVPKSEDSSLFFFFFFFPRSIGEENNQHHILKSFILN